MDTCGECAYFEKGRCNASGWLGCKDEDYLKIDASHQACEAFQEK